MNAAAGPARRPLAGGLVVLVMLPVLLLTGGPARAETADEAETRARALQEQVRTLQAEVQEALAAYDAALGGLAGAVNSNVTADMALGDAAEQASAAEQLAGSRVRAIYRSGGPLSLYATVLDGNSPNDLLTRMQTVRRMVAADRLAVEAGRSVLDSAQSRARAARAIANNRAQAAAIVRGAASAVQRLLDQQAALLREARTTATRLRAEEAALAAAQASYGSITSTHVRDLDPISMPPPFERLYRKAAATCRGLSWTILAAIGQVETGHGRNKNVSSAGAQGPMQFMPATFAAYGVDGDKDGDVEILDPADAIFSAANYLCANGAGRGNLDGALWHYNHADWYVAMVLRLAPKYGKP